MSTDELLDTLVRQMYRPPFWTLRQNLGSMPEILRIPILIIDLDSEVHINGILGFLENSTGRYLAETIDALETIAARDTAEILRTIQRIMIAHGVTHERLRSDFAGVKEFDITTFNELHGEELSSMADLVLAEAKKLYVYDGSAERVFDLLSAYLERHRDELVAALETYSRRGDAPS